MPWGTFHERASNQPKTTVQTRWMRAVGVRSRSHGDTSHFVETHFNHQCTGGAEPEELSIRRAPFKCVEISRVEEFELHAASWVNTATDHVPPLQLNLWGLEKQSCDRDHRAAWMAGVERTGYLVYRTDRRHGLHHVGDRLTPQLWVYAR